jgi:uncharacterized membrane protein YccC
MWVADRIGLQDSYWAGISAVVATAGTLGASLGAAVSRISATVVGLLVGLAAFALPVTGVLVSGLTVFVALVVLAALRLDTGARLGAATTLIVTAIPGNNAVGDALARGANVPVGCVIAVAVGFAFLPRRAGGRLRFDVRADVERTGALAQSALLAYVGASSADDLAARHSALLGAVSTHVAALRDARREPGEHGERLLQLEREVGAVEALVDDVGSLVRVAAEAAGDTAPSIIRREVQDAAESLAHASRTLRSSLGNGAFRDSLAPLTQALAALDTAFAAARERRATAEFSTAEVARLLSVIRVLHDLASVLWRFEAEALEVPVDRS